MRLRSATLHRFRLFQSLGSHLRHTRVAEELLLTQPAVSIQIKRLEESVGMPLVEQLGKELFAASRDEIDRPRDYPKVMPRLTITNRRRVRERLENNLDDPVSVGTVPGNMDMELDTGLLALLEWNLSP